MKANYLTLHSALKMYLVSGFSDLIIIKSQKRHLRHWCNVFCHHCLLDLGHQKINSGLELGGITLLIHLPIQWFHWPMYPMFKFIYPEKSILLLFWRNWKRTISATVKKTQKSTCKEKQVFLFSFLAPASKWVWVTGDSQRWKVP